MILISGGSITLEEAQGSLVQCGLRLGRQGVTNHGFKTQVSSDLYRTRSTCRDSHPRAWRAGSSQTVAESLTTAATEGRRIESAQARSQVDPRGEPKRDQEKCRAALRSGERTESRSGKNRFGPCPLSCHAQENRRNRETRQGNQVPREGVTRHTCLVPRMRPSAGDSYPIEWGCWKKFPRLAPSRETEERPLRASSSDG